MIKAVFHTWIVILLTLSLYVAVFVPPTLAYTAPTLTIEIQATTATSTTYAITLTDNSDLLNVIEFELIFDSRTLIEIENIKSELCRPELTVANMLATSTGSWYVACGTFIPFSGSMTTLATFTAPNSASASEFSFGTNTALYLHDGLGTKISPILVSLQRATNLLETITTESNNQNIFSLEKTNASEANVGMNGKRLSA